MIPAAGRRVKRRWRIRLLTWPSPRGSGALPAASGGFVREGVKPSMDEPGIEQLIRQLTTLVEGLAERVRRLERDRYSWLYDDEDDDEEDDDPRAEPDATVDWPWFLKAHPELRRTILTEDEALEALKVVLASRPAAAAKDVAATLFGDSPSHSQIVTVALKLRRLADAGVVTQTKSRDPRRIGASWTVQGGTSDAS